jgi:hypothetical protein
MALVDLIRNTVEPAVDSALLHLGAPLPLRVRIDLESASGGAPGTVTASVELQPARRDRQAAGGQEPAREVPEPASQQTGGRS